MAMSPAVLSHRAQRRLTQGYRAHFRGDLMTALRCYQRVVAEAPTHPIALHYAALAGWQINQHAKQEKKPMADEEVLTLMALSIAAAPDNPGAVHNFAKMKHDRGELEEARQLYENAIRLKPDLSESWTNLGNVWGELGDREKAEECWNVALMCPGSGSADSRFNLSMLKLLRGDYVGGWADYESRWESPTFRFGYQRPDVPGPKWDGTRVRTLYLHAEQGGGDALMMARYIPLATERAARVIVETPRGLTSLFRETFPELNVRTRGAPVPPHDAQLPLMSCPAVFGTTLETVPKPVRFAGTRIDRDGIRPEPGKIGLCWKGSSSHPNDRVRSMPTEAIADLVAMSQYRWQSLQFGVEDVAGLQPLITSDYLETALEIATCEKVITVDTSIAHLAASMGVETWILLPIHAEWRWLQDRADSPWYPSACLIRQRDPGNWNEVVDQVRRRLL